MGPIWPDGKGFYFPAVSATYIFNGTFRLNCGMIGGDSRNGMMETVLGLVNEERVSADILDPLGVLTL